MQDADLHALLSPLASALAGRHIDVYPGKPGEPSWSDGLRIYLDPQLSAQQRRETCAAQALLLASGCFDRSRLRALLGRPGTTRRYMALELGRALRLRGAELPHRIEHELRRACPTQDSAAGEASLRSAKDNAVDITALPTHLGVLRPARVSRKAPSASVGTNPSQSTLTQDRVRAAELEQHDEDAELVTSGHKWLDWLSTPLGGGAVSDFFLKLLGFGRSPGQTESEGDGGGSAALGEAALVTVQSSGSAQQLADKRAAALLAAPAHTRFKYPEWSGSAQRYLRDHVHVHELHVEPNIEHPTPQAQPMRSLHRAVRAQLARVGLEIARHRAQPDGHELDLDRVVQFAVERRSGYVESAPRAYVTSRRTRRDLTLLTLLDVSQSTGDRNELGTSIFVQARELGAEVTRTCERLGDRAGLCAFHSWGRHQVRMLRVKSFDERWGRRIEQRLEALQPAGLTRMGAAIRHATHLLAGDERHSHRVMLLLTDGFAYDDEYAHAHAEADTERALGEAAERGIACVCLNVGSQQDDAVLKRLYGSAAYLRCADTSKAVPALRRLIRSAIARAHG